MTFGFAAAAAGLLAATADLVLPVFEASILTVSGCREEGGFKVTDINDVDEDVDDEE